MSENLFAYTATNSGYSQGTAGAIYGERSATNSNGFVAVKNKIGDTVATKLNGDPAFFNFFQGNNSRLVLRQYSYSTTDLIPNRIIAPQGDWNNPVASKVWPAVANLHAVANFGSSWLFATGYDLSKIAVINMNSSYTQQKEYSFPGSFSNFINPYSDGVYHGEALVVAGNYLYALFYVNQGSGYGEYYESIVAKFNISARTGELTFISYVTAGKNSFTLDLYDNKLYVCSLGGIQNAGSGNVDTKLSIIDLNNYTQVGVINIEISNPIANGDFRDISIVDNEHVYLFLGHYDSSYGNLVGGIYFTNILNLTTPTNWIKIIEVNSGGYLWGIHADNYRLWFVKGTPINIYDGLPKGIVTTPNKVFSITDMSDYSGGNLNSACFISQDVITGEGIMGINNTHITAKSLAAHIRLAREACELYENSKN